MRKILTLDSSQIDTFEQCPSLWHYGYQKRIEPLTAEAKTAMNIGTYGHKLMELYYKSRADGKDINTSIESALAFDFDGETCRCGHSSETHGSIGFGECSRISCHCPNFEPVMFPLDHTERKATQQRFLDYTNVYSYQDFTPINSDSVEVGFSVPILDTDEKLYILEGRIDVLATLNGQVLFVDHKWQMRRHDLYLKSIQFRNYSLATNLTCGIVNYVRTAKKIDENTFSRAIINVSKLEQLAWKDELITIFDRVQMYIDADNWESPYAKRRSSCPGRYGYPCQYAPLCDEVIPFLVKQKEEMLYKIRPEWKPWG